MLPTIFRVFPESEKRLRPRSSKEFKSIENAYEHIEEVMPKRAKNKLEEFL